MTITAIPTRTVGSLGPTKVNRRAISDPYRQADADEWNLAADDLIHLTTQVGIESSPAWDSLQGLASGDTFILHEKMDRAWANSHEWDANWTPPTVLTTGLRGGWSFPLDDITGSDAYYWGYPFARAQSPRVHASVNISGNPGTAFELCFRDSTGNEGWGVKFLAAGGDFYGYTRTGGADTDVSVAKWSAGNQSLVDMRVVSNVLQVRINGSAWVSCGTVPAGSMQYWMWTGSGGTAGKVSVVRNLLILADWSA